jgi:hypothetical protein
LPEILVKTHLLMHRPYYLFEPKDRVLHFLETHILEV